MDTHESPGQLVRAKRFTCLSNMHHLKYHFLKDEIGGERTIPEIGSIKQMIWFLSSLEQRVKEIARTKNEPWIRTYRGGYALSPSATRLWHAIRGVQERAPGSLVEGRRLNPWLDVGLRLAYQWQPTLAFRTTRNEALDGSDEVARQGMDEIFRIIRSECNTKLFRDKVYSDNRSAKDSYFRCAKYMLSLFRDHARPLIIRVDFYFEGDARDVSESAAARKAEDKLMRGLRERRIVPNVLRYILKREDGLERRIHYHLLVAMDGDEHRDAFHFGELLGKFWVDECVGSPELASYFNVWVRRNELEYSCLGHLHHADADKLEGLRRALWYLCEPGAHVLVHESLGRNLRKGLAPKVSRSDARGRPRRLGASLATAETILLAPVPAGPERVVIPEPPAHHNDSGRA